MKTIAKTLTAAVAALMFLAYAAPTFAADLVTITGEGKCAKCALHESDKCQNVIQKTDKDGKTTTYWLTANDVSKGFHENLCKGPKKVTATGVVTEKDGKTMLTVTKIEVAE